MCMNYIDFAYPLPCEVCREVKVSRGWRSFGYRALCTRCKRKKNNLKEWVYISPCNVMYGLRRTEKRIPLLKEDD